MCVCVSVPCLSVYFRSGSQRRRICANAVQRRNKIGRREWWSSRRSRIDKFCEIHTQLQFGCVRYSIARGSRALRNDVFVRKFLEIKQK